MKSEDYIEEIICDGFSMFKMESSGITYDVQGTYNEDFPMYIYVHLKRNNDKCVIPISLTNPEYAFDTSKYLTKEEVEIIMNDLENTDCWKRILQAAETMCDGECGEEKCNCKSYYNRNNLIKNFPNYRLLPHLEK